MLAPLAAFTVDDGQDLAGGDLCPGRTSISVTVPACGAATVCCIFIASSTSTGSPGGDLGALLDGDADHGAGHRREQAAARDRVGRVGEPRARGSARRDPSGQSTSTASPAIATSYVVRTPSARASPASGSRATTARPSTT